MFKIGNGTSKWSQIAYSKARVSNLVLKLNNGTTEGTNMFTFDGSTTKTVNITPSAIGAAATSHGTHVPSVCSTITDWNSATSNGWYMGNNASNSPTTGWYFGCICAHNANYLIQEVYQFTVSSDATSIPKYIRAKMNGTWGAWANVTVAKAVPASAQFTDTTYSTFKGATSSAAGESGLVPPARHRLRR